MNHQNQNKIIASLLGLASVCATMPAAAQEGVYEETVNGITVACELAVKSQSWGQWKSVSLTLKPKGDATTIQIYNCDDMGRKVGAGWTFEFDCTKATDIAGTYKMTVSNPSPTLVLPPMYSNSQQACSELIRKTGLKVEKK